MYVQGGQRTSPSRANKGKYLRFLKKIISDYLRKYVRSLVFQDQFQCTKMQLSRTYGICLYPLSFVYEMQPFTRTLRKTDHEDSFPKCPGKWHYFIK